VKFEFRDNCPKPSGYCFLEFSREGVKGVNEGASQLKMWELGWKGVGCLKAGFSGGNSSFSVDAHLACSVNNYEDFSPRATFE
jgi:hypothetical protein